MSIDRELIERAAKAISLPECGWMGPAFMYVKDNTFTDWDPLNDDGDALRLAVALDIEIGSYSQYGKALAFYGPTRGHGEFWEEGDRLSATRRAIVRAAAEIGRSTNAS